MDFQTVDKFTSNALAIQDAPRMRTYFKCYIILTV